MPPAGGTGTQFFLKIDNIEGESTVKGHEKEIELLSWSWGETSQQLPAGSNAQGKVTMQDVHVEMAVSKASPKLFQACTRGENLKSALLTGQRGMANKAQYLKITFSELWVTSYQSGTLSDEKGTATDRVSFNFAR